MTRSEVRTFLELGVTTLNTAIPYADVAFGSGRITEWNSGRSNTYPGVWWESILPDSAELINNILPKDEYPIRLHIGKKDAVDSSAEQYEQIVDESHELAQQLIYNYNQALTGSEGITITSITREPFVKKHADCVSGVILNFTLSAPDKTQLC
jgi:hypothetical protein